MGGLEKLLAHPLPQGGAGTRGRGCCNLSAHDLGGLDLSAQDLGGVEFECTGFGEIQMRTPSKCTRY